MDISTTLQLVRNEVDRATKMYPPFSSPHEGISIIEEEYLELRREVYLKQSKRDPERLETEAIHLAAMAVRFLVDLKQ